MHDHIEQRNRTRAKHDGNVVFIGFDKFSARVALSAQDDGDIKVDIQVSKEASTEMLRFVMPRVVVVNIDQIDCYGPRFVSDIRKVLQSLPNLSIIVIGGPPFEGFHDQLRSAGATEICNAHDLSYIVTKTCREALTEDAFAVQLWEKCLQSA